MTVNQIKKEIQKSLDHVPESTFKQILAYLQEVQRSGLDKANLSTNLNKILKEDHDLLQRLAK